MDLQKEWHKQELKAAEDCLAHRPLKKSIRFITLSVRATSTMYRTIAARISSAAPLEWAYFLIIRLQI